MSNKILDVIEKSRKATPEEKIKQAEAREAKERQRLTEWLEFLKEDADWDFCHILQTFAYKLGRTRKCLVANRMALDADRIGKAIQEVEDLLKKVEDEDNYRGPINELDKKFGKVQQKNVVGLPNGGMQYTIQRAKETAKNEKEIRKATRKAYRDSHRMRVKDLKKAFNIIAEQCWEWWD